MQQRIHSKTIASTRQSTREARKNVHKVALNKAAEHASDNAISDQLTSLVSLSTYLIMYFVLSIVCALAKSSWGCRSYVTFFHSPYRRYLRWKAEVVAQYKFKWSTLTHWRSQGRPRAHAPKFLAYLVILCFEKRRPKLNQLIERWDS